MAFERYAVDLAAFNQDGNGDVVYKPRERSTTQLLFPDKNEFLYQIQSGRFRAELHERLSAWLYPLAMMAIDHLRANGKRLGKTSAELGWILEDNKATNNIIRSVGGVHYKTHRIYEKALVN